MSFGRNSIVRNYSGGRSCRSRITTATQRRSTFSNYKNEPSRQRALRDVILDNKHQRTDSNRRARNLSRRSAESRRQRGDDEADKDLAWKRENHLLGSTRHPPFFGQ